MPEGDTVYRLARRLDTALAGGVLARAQLRVARYATADLTGRTVLDHDTHGKHLLTRMSDGLTLHTHLRMSGSWTVTRPGRRLPTRLWPSVRVVLGLEEGLTAHGLDLPVVDLLRTSEERLAVGHLGPDPLRADFDPALAAANVSANPGRAIITALLDQRSIAVWATCGPTSSATCAGYTPGAPPAMSTPHGSSSAPPSPCATPRTYRGRCRSRPATRDAVASIVSPGAPASPACGAGHRCES